MISSVRQELLTRFNGNQPASDVAIGRFREESHIDLPDDYMDFMRQMDGGEGFIGDSYIILWRIEELLDLNKAYQDPEFAPGLFLFGSNGGDEVLAFDTSVEMQIVVVPFISMKLEEARPVAANFKVLFEEIAKGLVFAAFVSR